MSGNEIEETSGKEIPVNVNQLAEVVGNIFGAVGEQKDREMAIREKELAFQKQKTDKEFALHKQKIDNEFELESKAAGANREAVKRNSWYIYSVVVAVFVIAAALIFVKDDKDSGFQLLGYAGSAIAGFFGGYGFKSWKNGGE